MSKIFSGLMMKRIIIVAAIALTGLFVSCADSGDDPAVNPNPVPANQAAGIYFYDTNNESDKIGGTLFIVKAADESAITHYVLYWGSDSTTKIGSPIAEIKKTGNNYISYYLTSNRVIKGSHFLVFSKTAQGEESTCAHHAIKDLPVKYAITGTFGGASSVYGADVDGDGDLDILGAARESSAITWWENDGTPEDGGWIKHTIAGAFSGACSVYGADVDGDGDLDVIGAANYAGAITWWENDGTPGDGGWIEHSIVGTFYGANSVYGADVDGDGDLDVIGTSANYKITWWENDGTPRDGGWTRHIIPSTFEGANSVYGADVDGDGDLDLLGAAFYVDDITWWENDGTPGNGGWTEHTIAGYFDGANSVYGADVDGDGDLDVIGTAYYVDAITWWENDGTPEDGGWTEHAIAGYFDGANSVYGADVDGDGDLDVLGAANYPGAITWWENDGTPGNGGWTEHTIAGAYKGASSVYGADINGDGYPDVLGANSYTNEIIWLEIIY